MFTYIGPPLPPSPRFYVLNTSALQISWEKPFTWPDLVDITHYRLNLYNTTSHERFAWTIPARCNATVYLSRGDTSVECSEQEANSNDLNASHVATILADWTPRSCHTLVFQVSAANMIGENDSPAIRGAFEIGKHYKSCRCSILISISRH